MVLRGQSAVEYLMTYGWMLLVVAVVGGAVFSVVGQQNINSVSGFDSSHISVQDFGVSQENGLMFSMTDPLGETEIQEIKISNPETTNVTYALNQKISEENVVSLPGINPSEGSSELEVEILYDMDSLENISTSGTVTGGLEVDRSFDNRTMVLDGLVGYWPLDEKYSSDNEVYDLTSNNNHGELVNEPTKSDADECKIGGCLNFDGSNSVRVADSSDFNITKHLTVNLWVKPRSLPFNDWNDILNRYDRNEGWDIIGVSGESKIRLETFNEGSTSGFVDSPNIPEDEWSHISLVYNKSNSNELKGYLNGKNFGSTTVELDSLNQDVYFASQYGSPQFNGSMDEVHIYNRALSEDEIQTIYEQGVSR